MRLDKYLKVSRLIKRRTIAKEATSNEYVYVNGKPQKPGYKLKLKDIIKIKFAVKIIEVEVTSLFPQKDELMYKIIKEERVAT